MFGCIVSGRLVSSRKTHYQQHPHQHLLRSFVQVQTDFQQVGDSQFLINIPEADHINHIVVFLTGTMPLPLGMAGSVYFSWPDPNRPPAWMLLGYISNSKPSAIFKISQMKQCAKSDEKDNNGTVVPYSNVFGSQPISHIAQIGVSIEPEANVVQCTPSTVCCDWLRYAKKTITASNQKRSSHQQQSAVSCMQFGQKMLENFFNYASSFATTQSQMQPNPSESFVPLSTLQNWYVNFERRLQQNPNFWKS